MMDWSDLTEEQQKIAGTFDENLCVTAGAGTGKTTTLTARYMKLFDRELEKMDSSDSIEGPEDLPLRPTEVVATTFTNRAARDLEDSTREEITDRLESASTVFEHNYWQAVARDLNDAYIHTLHSFCSRMLTEFSLESELVEPGFEVIEGVEQSELIEQTVNQVLERNDDETEEKIELLSELHGRYQLTAILTGLINERPESREWVEEWADKDPEEYAKRSLDKFYPVSGDRAKQILSGEEVQSALDDLVRLRENPPEGIEEDDMDTAWDNLTEIVEVLKEHEALTDEEIDGRRSRIVLNEICDTLTSNDGEVYSQEYRYYGTKGSWSGYEDSKETLKEGMSILLEELDPSENLVSSDITSEERVAPYVICLADLTEKTLDRYKEVKSERNLLDNTDLITYTLELLKDDSIRERLNKEIEHVMVDEFQDTDPRQWDIVRALTEAVRSGDKENDGFRGENVFVVGDKKQSIYRFRNADVTAFDETAEAIRSSNRQKERDRRSGREVPNELSVNFRTLPNTLGFLNGLFENIFGSGEDSEYEASPQSLEAGRIDPGSLSHRPEYVIVPTEDELAEELCSDSHNLVTEEYVEDSEMEAYAVASRIAVMLEDGTEVYDEDTLPDDASAEPRPVEPGDIAVLIRSRTHLKSYEQALEEAGVPYSVASGVGFHDTPEVTAFKNLFETLANPEDDISLYGVLRSPLFGLSDEEIAEAYLSGGEGRGSLWEAIKSETEKKGTEDRGSQESSVERSVAQIKRWRSRLGLSPRTKEVVESWSGFLTEVIEETGYLGSVSSDERGEQAVENVEKFRELIRQFEGDGNISLRRLLQRIRTHKESDNEEGEAALPEEVTGVEIMTIHDAKGEEFPVVIVPNVDRGFHDRASLGNGAIEFETLEGKPWLGMKAPDEDDPFSTASTRTREAIREQRRNEEYAEEKRVLYVASTRARDKLVYVGQSSGEVLEDSEGEVEIELEDCDPEDPNSWRDWVQYELLPDGLPEDITKSGIDRATMVIGDGSGESYEYEIRLPEEDYPDLEDRENAESEPVYEMSPDPEVSMEESAYSYRLTASSIPGVIDDRYGTQFSVDEIRKTVTKSKEESGGDSEQEGDKSEVKEIPPTLFGDLVHMLAERRPAREKQEEVIREFSRRHEEGYIPTEQEISSIVEHADVACEYVDRETPEGAEIEVDEITVVAEFEHGEIKGDIDHLIVTEEEYIIIDYKTNSVESEEDIDELTSYYQPQLDVYGAALVQEDSRDVRTSLYFTGPEEAREKVYSEPEIIEKGEEIDGDIWSQIIQKRDIQN
jgi:ATP-dependent helicase/nuclease subunit A